MYHAVVNTRIGGPYRFMLAFVDREEALIAVDPASRIHWTAINEATSIYPYGPEVQWRIRQGQPTSYQRVAEELNTAPVDVFFFFKQKTAYEITRCLEFRRVLFRSLTISGFINATLYNDRGRFASFGQGQNSEFSVQNQVGADQSFTDGDFRNTRLRFDFAAQPVLGKWAPKATVEVDFFGAFNGSPPFGDEQPQMRGRVIYADLTNGRTTVRIGQDWSPSFAETPVSLTHIAFPLGYGASGKIGWRFPGVFLFQDLSATGAPLTVQLQLAAMKGSGPIAPGNAR